MGYLKTASIPIILISIAGLLSGCQDVPEVNEENEKPMMRKVVTLPAGTVVNRDFFAFGESVEISGTVNGDVYAVAGQILVDGVINGDLLAAGGRVIISGTVSQDARIAGGQITINGEVKRNLTAAGGNIELTNSAGISGGTVVAGGNIHFGSPVGRDVKIAAGNLTISNRVDGNVHAAAGALRLTSRAIINGNLTYVSKSPASIDEAAKVSGVISERAFPEKILPPGKALAVIAGMAILIKLISFISTLIIGLLLVQFYPKASQTAVHQLRERPLACLGLGFLVFLLTPVIGGLLVATIVGAPLAFLFVAVFLITIYLSRIFVILWVGLLLFERWGKQDNLRWAFFVGLVLYALITLIPIVGPLVTLLVALFGVGTALLTKKKIYSSLVY